MNELLQFCNNCEKTLPESKFDLHLGYCRRNIKKCDQCGRPYDINEAEQHQQQFHSYSNCQHCGLKILLNQLTQHVSLCTEKPIACVYCQLPIPTEKFQQHRIHCQSRTKTCQKCTRPVMNKEYFQHFDLCTGPPQYVPPASDNISSQYTSSMFSSPYTTSYTSNSELPRQVIRTYTRTTTTDPRTGEVTTVVNEDSNNNQPRIYRRPYNPTDNIIRHESRVISNGSSSNRSSNYPTNSSTYTTNYTSPASNYTSYGYENGSQQQYSENDDPELQAALMASLGFQDQNTPDLYSEIVRQQEEQKRNKK